MILSPSARNRLTFLPFEEGIQGPSPDPDRSSDPDVGEIPEEFQDLLGRHPEEGCDLLDGQDVTPLDGWSGRFHQGPGNTSLTLEYPQNFQCLGNPSSSTSRYRVGELFQIGGKLGAGKSTCFTGPEVGNFLGRGFTFPVMEVDQIFLIQASGFHHFHLQ